MCSMIREKTNHEQKAFGQLQLLCILTSFWVHAVPKSWSKYTTCNTLQLPTFMKLTPSLVMTQNVSSTTPKNIFDYHGKLNVKDSI